MILQPLSVLFCPTARLYRAKLFSMYKKKSITSSEILGSLEGVRLFAVWAPETKLFGRSESSGEASETYVGKFERVKLELALGLLKGF